MTLEQIEALGKKRAALRAELATVNAELRKAVVKAIQDGQLSEHGAHELTGVARMSIRSWLGK